MSWTWTYKKILSIQKILSPLVSAVFCQGCTAFGTEAGIRLEWGKHGAELVHMKGQLQQDLRRSLCGAAAAAANVGLTRGICTDLIQMLAMQESKE